MPSRLATAAAPSSSPARRTTIRRFGEAESQRFVFNLAGAISKKDYRILSGFGLGVGSAVIAGVIEVTAMGGRALDEDRLLVRPFPQVAPGMTDLAQLWSRYRDDILQRAGVAIFLFGNKLSGGAVVHSNGMREEFNLALANNVFPIPVGITGGMARELWTEALSLIDSGRLVAPSNVRALIAELGAGETTLPRAHNIILELLGIL
ncbi:hypothetical protein P3W24_12300 [Luteibacter sp. PPL201]|uniref:NAD(+) hydrolase ThsA Sir2/TIR-associating SLOG domain-containing protein n=1 Tax=Luteibacter sahnii TaxID=3021977 RepID=A0ABT6BCH5_9GAMM